MTRRKETEPSKTLGGAVRERRISLGLSQERASSLAGLSKQAWLDIEQDRRSPRDLTLRQVEGALQLEPGALTGDLDQLAVVPAPDSPADRLTHLEERFDRLSEQVAEMLVLLREQTDRPDVQPRRRGSR